MKKVNEVTVQENSILAIFLSRNSWRITEFVNTRQKNVLETDMSG